MALADENNYALASDDLGIDKGVSPTNNSARSRITFLILDLT